jgi:methyl-accepting chemotaxis protein
MLKKLVLKIILYIGALVLAVALGLGISANYFASRTVTAEAESALLQMTDMGAVEVNVRIQSRLDVLYELANRERMQSMNWQLQQRTLKDDVERLGYLDMAVVTPDGIATYVLGGNTAELGDRAYVIKAFGGETNVSDVIISRVTNSAVLMFASPIYNGNKVVGVLIARRDGNALNDVTDQMGFGEKGYAYVINTKGTTVAHPNRENVMEQINLIEKAKEDENFKSVGAMVEKALAEGRGVGGYSFNGSKMYSAYSPIPGTDWILVNIAIEDEVLSGLTAMRGILLMVTIGFLVLGILVSAWIGRSIASPITLLSKQISKISEYDLTDDGMLASGKLLHKQDEIGVIAKALQTMKQNLVGLIKEISADAINVAASSEELTATSQQSALAADDVAKTIEEIANGASEQAKETSKGAHEIGELADTISAEIELVKVLNKSAEQVNQLKEEGFVVLKDLEEKTDQNNAAARGVQAIIIETNQSAEKIEAASDMIKNIADQTNLLALNAAIEAARAGDAGRGFAVVADEIRKLAEQSNKFAGDISSVIIELSGKTTSAVTMMEDASHIVSAQMSSLKNTHHKFEGISEAVESVKSAVSELIVSTTYMTKKKEEIVSIIDSLSSISEQNAAGAEEASASVEEQTAAMAQIADASEDLAKLAEAMQKSISRFRM